MAVTVRVRAAKPGLKNPWTGKPLSPDEYVEMPATSEVFQWIKRGELIREPRKPFVVAGPEPADAPPVARKKKTDA